MLGTDQGEDILCCEFTDNPKWMMYDANLCSYISWLILCRKQNIFSFLIVCSGAEVSDCGRYVILTIRQGCDPVNKLYYCDLQSMKDGIKGNW